MFLSSRIGRRGTIRSMYQTPAPQMVERLKGAGFDVTRMPMAQLAEQMLKAWFDEIEGQ